MKNKLFHLLAQFVEWQVDLSDWLLQIIFTKNLPITFLSRESLHLLTMTSGNILKWLKSSYVNDGMGFVLTNLFAKV